MTGAGGRWAHEYRWARVVFVLAVLAVVLVYVGLNASGEVVERSSTTGVVVEIYDEIALIELPAGEHTRLWFDPPPEKGQRVPLVRVRYEDGTVRYRVHRSWSGEVPPRR